MKQPTEAKGLIIDGVEHRKLKVGETVEEGDQTRRHLGDRWKDTNAAGVTWQPHGRYTEVKTEAKPPPESFLEKIAMECGTVDGYAPSDLMRWIESVKS